MNFEELGKKVKKLGQDTMTEVQKLNEIRQLNSRINDQKKQMVSVYAKMGQKLYEMYKDETMEGFETEFRELEERNAAIGIFQDQIRDIKGVRVCPNCNVEVSVKERFCSSCGHKLPEILKIEKQEDGTEVIEGADTQIIDAETIVPENMEAVSEEVKDTEEAGDTVEAEEESEGTVKAETAEETEQPDTAASEENTKEAEETETEECVDESEQQKETVTAEETETSGESPQPEEEKMPKEPARPEEEEAAEEPVQPEEEEAAEEPAQPEEEEVAEEPARPKEEEAAEKSAQPENI